jgi:tetratricopeptide (TPR) repeat protein
MGYLFQMKAYRKITLRLLLGTVLLFVTPQTLPASLFSKEKGTAAETEQYVYEEKDQTAEKKRYLVKLEQDKRKCDLAIANTKTLIGRSKNRPYLPELYLRLAELYIEKSRLVYFLRQSQYNPGEKRALDQYEANTLKTQAIEIYQRIINQFPEFQYLDKVHFFMAHEYHELGRTDEMIAQYRTIVKNFSGSGYAPEAQLLLGDYFFNQKQDVDSSTRHYEAVLAHPQSPAVAAARYKLAWCRINQKDFKGAMTLFEASVTSSPAAKALDIDTYGRVDVRLESLVDLAFCYPEVYKQATAEQALAYFKQYAWSRPVYTTVLEKLAYRYYVKKNWSLAASIYRELALHRQDPEKLLEYARSIFESVQAMGTYRHAEKDVGIIVRALSRQVSSVRMAREEKNKLIHDYEIFARDIITHLHAKASKTNATRDYEIAADAYEQYLGFFTASEFTAEMAHNYAEALFSAGRYLEAGKQYEEVTPPATINAKLRKETLYSAVISYYRALKNKEQLNFYQAAYARDGLRSIGRTFVGENPDSPYAPEVRFNVAWVSHDAGDFQQAVTDLSEFVDRYPRHKATPAAIHLIMDAYHLMENYDGMIQYGNAVLANAAINDANLKAEVAQMVQGAGARVVSSITMAANDDWESTRRELTQVADRSQKTQMGEQALNALILSSKDKKDLATLFDAGTKLIDHYPDSPNAKETLGIMINTAVSIGQLRALADYLETLCHRYPKEENRADFLLQAARIREGLGQYGKANQNYRHLLALPKQTAPPADEIVFAMVENMKRIDQSAAAMNLLSTHQKRLPATAMVRANAQMAILHMEADRRSLADKFHRQAKKAYRTELGEADPILRELMAELAYRQVTGTSGPYFKLRLKNQIDNSIVQKKAALLKKLEEDYQQVMAYKSPAWALKACFRANEINAEFADFLLSSPLPQGLSTEQQAQYQNLIRQKAQAYRDKADEYVKTCVALARKWEICDPALSGYFHPADHPQGGTGGLASVGGGQAGIEIGVQAMGQRPILELYEKRLDAPDDENLQFQLATLYMEAGDYRQAGLIARNALAMLDRGNRRLRAKLLNLVGLSLLCCGEDSLAKETFKRALEADERLASARMNLAGVYRHYGHAQKAADLLEPPWPMNPDQGSVHPRLGAVNNERVMAGQ